MIIPTRVAYRNKFAGRDPEELVQLEIPNGVPLVYEPQYGTLTLLSDERDERGAEGDGHAPDAASELLVGSAWEALRRGPPPAEE